MKSQTIEIDIRVSLPSLFLRIHSATEFSPEFLAPFADVADALEGPRGTERRTGPRELRTGPFEVRL